MKSLTKLPATIMLLSVLIFCISCRGGYGNAGGGSGVFYSSGIGLGTVIAIVISWSRNHSILWAIIHGFLGWLYVIYSILVKPKNI